MDDITNFPRKSNNAAKNIFLILGTVLIADTIILRFTSNWNLGIIIPALLGIPLFLYGLFKDRFDCWFQTKAGKYVKWVFIIGYLSVAAIVAIGSVIIINGKVVETDEKADAVIVLGAGIREDKPSYTLKNRLDAAAEYYHKNPDVLLVVSGGYGNEEKYSEAYVMAKYLIEEKNVPAYKIIREDKSTSTVENFFYSKEILDKKLSKDYKVAYVTNDFHTYRAGLIAKDAGMDAFGISARTPVLITPNCYLRESLALLKRALLGS